MDLRVKRTRNSIINAFIQLRSKKELEKITVKELSELACINKATFYQHFRDIYDLSENLENEVLSQALLNMDHPENIISNPREGVKNIANALLSSHSLLSIIFSGNRSSLMVDRLEMLLREIIYTNCPRYKDDLKVNVILTVLIQGSFRAFKEYGEDDPGQVLDILGDINEKIITANK